MYYLYFKTHNVTGLKYLGKTIKDPYSYTGSGTGWLEHLKEYGYDVTTEILCASENISDVRKKAREFQEKIDITQSPDYANRVIEVVPEHKLPETHGKKHFSGDPGDKLRCICPKCNTEIRTVFHYKDCHSSSG